MAVHKQRSGGGPNRRYFRAPPPATGRLWKRLGQGARATSLLFAIGLILPPCADGQADEPPFPAAHRLIADEVFRRSQAVAAAKAAGVAAEVALATFAASSFKTTAVLDSVFAHVSRGAVETHRETRVGPDSLERSFVSSLAADDLLALARNIGGRVADRAYREAFIAALDDDAGQTVGWDFVAHQGTDGSLTYYELQRPYFDVGSLQWIDATRIRVTRFSISAP
jgi:hypothetical protein